MNLNQLQKSVVIPSPTNTHRTANSLHWPAHKSFRLKVRRLLCKKTFWGGAACKDDYRFIPYSFSSTWNFNPINLVCGPTSPRSPSIESLGLGSCCPLMTFNTSCFFIWPGMGSSTLGLKASAVGKMITLYLWFFTYCNKMTNVNHFNYEFFKLYFVIL